MDGSSHLVGIISLMSQQVTVKDGMASLVKAEWESPLIWLVIVAQVAPKMR